MSWPGTRASVRSSWSTSTACPRSRCCRWTVRCSTYRSRTSLPTRSTRPSAGRPSTPSTCPRRYPSAPPCCAPASASTSCSCWSTTSPATASRWSRSRATWPPRTPPGCAARPRSGPTCRSSTSTTRCGSANCSATRTTPAAWSPPRSPTGRANSRARRRRCACPRTARARRWPATGGTRSASRSTPSCSPPSRPWAASGT